MRVSHAAAVLAVAAGCSDNTLGTRNAAPEVVITSHADADTVVDANPFLARASAGDADNRPEELVASWFVANEPVEACQGLAVDEDGVTACEVTLTLDLDPWRIRVEARDPRGAVGFDIVDLDVRQGDNGAPAVEIVAPDDATTSNAGAPRQFRATVSDAADPPTAVTLEWSSSIDGAFSTQGADSSGTALFVDASLSPGLHVITLRGEDSDGNYTTDVITHTVNGVPSAPVVSIAPGAPTSAQDLFASIDVASTDPESQPVSYTWEWLKDGVVQTGQTSSLVLSAATRRGEQWTVRAWPTDGIATGPFGAASVDVGNTAPVVQSVVISPDPAHTATLLVASVTANDADLDPLTLSYDWQVDGTSAGTGTTLNGQSAFDRGDLVQLVVTANDGSTDGPPTGSNVVTIANSPPSPPVVSIAPTAPDEQVDDLLCAVDVPSVDPDPGDTVSYAVSWTVDGDDYPRIGDVGPFTSVLPGDGVDAADTSSGEAWTCSVIPSDPVGLAGLPGEDTVTIGVEAPDYDGTFSLDPSIVYACQDLFIGSTVININTSQVTLSVAGNQLSISGFPVVMRQTPAPVDENFSAIGVISGGCTETYTLSGSFTGPDTFTGTFNLSLTGSQCGWTNCTNRTEPVDGTRL